MESVTKKQVNNKLCFICGRIYSKTSPIHTFSIPPGKLDAWSRIVNGLLPESKLCHVHFKPEHINNGKFILGVFHPSLRWILTKDAEPQPHLLSPTPVCKNNFHFIHYHHHIMTCYFLLGSTDGITEKVARTTLKVPRTSLKSLFTAKSIHK